MVPGSQQQAFHIQEKKMDPEKQREQTIGVMFNQDPEIHKKKLKQAFRAHYGFDFPFK